MSRFKECDKCKRDNKIHTALKIQCYSFALLKEGDKEEFTLHDLCNLCAGKTEKFLRTETET